ncbi:hypothetical protein [Micromonospora violae]|uniref:hypothetical protein n=1 Tax=Micromonospora violae TaxID=1278207 RepID=UPI00102D1C49|nr:hypothetical protein [Micromonospora violae]
MVIGVAVLALLLALGSAAVSWRALDQAQTARDIASARGPAAPSAPAAEPIPSGPAVSADPEQTAASPEEPPRSPGTPPEITAETVYKPKYENQSLTLKTADCFAKMQVDLDEPRANVGSGKADVELGCRNNTPWFELAPGVEGSEAAKAGMKPGECGDAIRSAPIAAQTRVPLRKGSWLCVTTNFQTASAQRDEWRMILVEIVSIGNDGAVVIRATAWDIPTD